MPTSNLAARARNGRQGRTLHPLARFFAWYVSSQMVFESAIWILFLQDRGFSLAIGSLFVALSAILLWNAHSLPIAVLALFVSGANYSFRSGADQAYL